MSERKLKTIDGGTVTLSDETIEALAASLRGSIVTPDDDNFDEVRAIWNAMIDRRPGLIVRCAGAADVARAVNLARENRLLFTIRGIGHNIAGSSLCDDALMIDLSGMKSVRIDPEARTARVEPGVTLGEFDNEAQAYALATPVGINSTTGIAGLTVGGGFGWLSRKHGLTIDNLVSADVVTAQGELVHASAVQNDDLFWAIRGGGGNFGIVTSFEFDLHPVGPEVLSGLIVHPGEDAPEVLRAYREFCKQAPDEVTAWVVLRKAPPLPFLSEEVHGTDVIVLAAMYAGDTKAGEEALAPLRAIGKPIADVISPHPFTGWQAAFDPLLTDGLRNYWKSHDFAELSDEAIDTALRFAAELPSPHTEIFIAQMGGATARVAADATAYRHRDVQFIMNVHGRWEEPADDERCVSWCRELFDTLTPHATGGVYVNFMTEEEQQRVREAYGDSFNRLVEIKNSYDPDNLFRFNQNIQPAAQASG